MNLRDKQLKIKQMQLTIRMVTELVVIVECQMNDFMRLKINHWQSKTINSIQN